MAKRPHDFSDNTKHFVKVYFGHVCATCGDDDSHNLVADHHISGDASDAGTCMCHYCNNLKGKINVPEMFRFIPRKAIDENLNRKEAQKQLHANRDAFKVWLNQFRNFVKGHNYNLKNIKNFEAPF